MSTMTSEHVIWLGAENLRFLVRRADRRTLGITVFPDGTVLVSAPRDVSVDGIEERVRRRAAWILRMRNRPAKVLETLSI